MDDDSYRNNALLSSIIVIALGLLVYKWYITHDFMKIFYYAIPYIILTILIMLLSLIAVFALNNTHKSYKKASRILFHTFSFIVIALLIYRLIIGYIDFLFIPHIIISIIIFFFYNYLFHKKYFDHKHAIEKYKEEILKQREELDKIFSTNITCLSVRELEDIKFKIETALMKYDNNLLREYNSHKFLKKIKLRIEERKHEDKLNDLEHRKAILQADVKYLQKQKYNEQLTADDLKKKMTYDLELYKNHAFIKNELSNEQITILKENNYVSTNEYDLLLQKVVPVFVQKILKHTTTHTFLVWSIKRLLEKKLNIDNVEFHETKDADITFKNNGKYYAIEAETGNLLRKKRQLAEKIQYLNRKYPHRWIFIVSNRNLYAMYKKYGVTAQRIHAEQAIRDMLKVLHPKIGV